MMIKRLRSTLACPYDYVNHGVEIAARSMFMSGLPVHQYIRSLCKQKHYKDALRAFDVLEKNDHSIVDTGTYAQLLSACSFLRSIEYGRRIHKHILKSRLLPNMILENHIISMYGKCGSTTDARKVFDSMGERNVVSWTALCAGYGQNGLDSEAITCYIRMHQSDFVPDHFTFGSVIKACSCLNEVALGEQLHAQVIKSEFGSHPIAQNALISMYTKYDRINESRNIFSRIKSKDLISWSSMIAGFSKLGYEFEALFCFKEMLCNGTHLPNEFIFGSLLSACGSIGQLECGGQIHGMSIKYGLQGDAFAGCSLTDMYAKCGSLHSAKAAFNLIEYPDRVAWNALVAGFAYSGAVNESMLIFSQMRHLTVAPDDITLRSLLSGISDPLYLAQGKLVHSYIMKIGLDLDLPVCNTLLTMYANCCDYVSAYRLFEEIRGNEDLVSWNAIITMFLHQNQISQVFLLFKMMLILHRPDQITLVSILGACGKVGSLEMGDQTYCYSQKSGHSCDIMIVNGFIDMYVKCGSLERAKELFDSMQTLDVFSWSSMIMGYAHFGYGEEALNLFTRLTGQGIKPNQVTLVGVLTACSHVGLVDEGMQLFHSMEQVHGVIPMREHFSCVVDLLARSGRIHEAETFINEMAIEPDIVMWKALLAACKTRGNVEAGKRIAENILRIDPFNSAAHVLLCGLYASTGDWKDAAVLRSLMRGKGVKKVPGQSWIQIKDRIHAFSSEDGLHPERDQIFSILEELWLQILDVDYVPVIGYDFVEKQLLA